MSAPDLPIAAAAGTLRSVLVVDDSIPFIVQQFDCTVGQGFLLGRPMPADALLPWVKAHEARLPELRASLPMPAR
jgi:hypothetical protein